MPTSRHRVARQNGSGPPESFRPPSAHAGIVHCLSGPTAASPPSRRTMQPSSPWSVFQDGRGHSPSPCSFSFFTVAFSHFDRSTSPLSVIPSYLALGARTTPFRLHSQAALLIRPPHTSTGLTPPPARPSRHIDVRVRHTTRLRSYHTGSSAFARRYSQNPLSFLLLPLLICLSQRGSRAHRAHSDTGQARTSVSPPSFLAGNANQSHEQGILIQTNSHARTHAAARSPCTHTCTHTSADRPRAHGSPPTTHHNTDPAAGSPTAAMLRLISYLTHRTHASQLSSPASS